jgi:serine/threonine protein kinase
MTPERWQQVKDLLHSVLDQPAAEQAAFLNHAAGRDDSLRLEVESLLEFQEGNENFIETSALEITARSVGAEAQDEMAGAQIGPFKVEREIGRGGMGAVYLAQQNDNHYQRQVAIKIIKRGMDSDEIVRRFRNERQILANLTHQNIAALYSGGTTDASLPFFVMEYVEGKPINEYCAAQDLSIEERLKLFRTVCSAISYAHQNLVIHRDLKPSNILVTGDGKPKLLDFGIAKLLKADDEAALTETMLRVMTPEYASPEQARGERMTTASDVYSLGVVLYELLTGQRPFRLKNHLPHEIAQIISERAPERPSTAISRVEAMPEGAAAITTTLPTVKSPGELAKLRRSLRGDLDNIVLMAMRKDPARRYQSVEQFSEDIRRHLEKLPVCARKDTFDYRASKFILRNRLGVAAAAAVILVLMAGISTTRWEARRAQRRFNDVRVLANSFLFEFHDAIENLPGSTPARELVVKRALEYLNSLAQEAGNDPGLQRELAAAYFKVGDVQGRPNYANLGNFSGALESHRKSLALRQTLASAGPQDAAQQLELAESYDRVGEILAQSGDLGEALNSFRKGLAINERLAVAAPGDEKFLSELALLYRHTADVLGFPPLPNLGDPKGAMENYQKSLALYETLFASHPANPQNELQLASSHQRLGDLLVDLGDLPAALDRMNQALVIFNRALPANPNYPPLVREIGILNNKIGAIRLLNGDVPGALASMGKSKEILDRLLATDPANLTVMMDVGNVNRGLGTVLARTENKASALEHYEKALKIFSEVTVRNPASVAAHTRVSRTYFNIGEIYLELGEINKAIDQNHKGLANFDETMPQDESNQTRILKATGLNQMGACYLKLAAGSKSSTVTGMEHLREGREWFRQSLAIWITLRDAGGLDVENAGKPDEVAKEIASCDAALSASSSRTHS